MDWDRIGHEATLSATDQRIHDLEITATWLRDLLEPAERAHAAYGAEIARLETAMVEMRKLAAGRTATDHEKATYASLEGQLQRVHDDYRGWAWAKEVLSEDRSRIGNPQSWSKRWPDDLRKKLAATVDELRLRGVERDRIADELDRQDEAAGQDAPDQPRPPSWHQRLLGGRHAPAIE